jgi:hypothetical protein
LGLIFWSSSARPQISGCGAAVSANARLLLAVIRLAK